MSPSNRNHDEPFDRLIREALRTAEIIRPGGECLDAATVAAMADGTLTASERAAAEGHASGCDQCQAVLAAMARSEVDLAPARASWWRAPAIRWIGPLTAATAAAAALVIWLVVPDRSTYRAPTGEAASQAISTPADSKPAAAPKPEVSTPATPAPAGSAPAVSPPAAVSAPEVRPQSAPQSAQAQASAERQAAAKKAPASGAKESLLQFTGEAAAAKDANPAARARAANQAPRETDADKARAPGAAGVVAGAASGVVGGAVAGGATSLRDEAVQQKPAAPAAEALRGLDRLSRSDAVRLVVVAPDPAVRWRALERGLVERSTDGGSTWQTQATGVTATPTAGASPAPLTCWLVGPGGIVLLSTDGATWTRAPFPETVDLVSVRATDSKTAVVAASDGRAFKTEDGGQSWIRTPPQDF